MFWSSVSTPGDIGLPELSFQYFISFCCQVWRIKVEYIFFKSASVFIRSAFYCDLITWLRTIHKPVFTFLGSMPSCCEIVLYTGSIICTNWVAIFSCRKPRPQRIHSVKEVTRWTKAQAHYRLTVNVLTLKSPTWQTQFIFDQVCCVRVTNPGLIHGVYKLHL